MLSFKMLAKQCAIALLLITGAMAPVPARALSTGTSISGSWTVGTCTIAYELFSNGQGNISYLDGVLFRFLGGGGFVAISGGYWQKPLAGFDPRSCISGENGYRQSANFSQFQATSSVSYYGFSYCIGTDLYEYALSGLSNSVVISGNQGARAECAPPKIALSSSDSTLGVGETATITFTLTQPSDDFHAGDVTVTGGTLSAFSGSGTAYSATFTPNAGFEGNAVISVGTGAFTNMAPRNLSNQDGADANNILTLHVDQVAPDAPTLSAVQNPDGTITASGESTPGTTVTVTFPSGSKKDVLVGPSGSYSVTSEHSQPGGQIRAAASDGAFNLSPPSTATIVDQVDPVISDETVEQNSDGTLTVDGNTEPGATVTVSYPDGSSETVTAGQNTDFSATSDSAQPSGDVTINAQDDAGNQSDTVTIPFTDTQPPEPPTLDPVQNTDGSITASGAAEPGTTVTVTFPDGETQNVPSNGSFTTSSEPEQPTGPVRAIATDLSGNVSQPSVANARPNPDTTRPTAKLTQSQDGVVPGGTYTLGLDFSEAVTGLERSDLVLDNARVSGLSGSGSSYQITIEVSGQGDATLTLPEGSVVDAARNPNIALGPVPISSVSVEETRTQIADFLLSRTGNLLGTQPELIPFLRDQKAGHFKANITAGNGTFSYASPADQVIWTRLDGSWSSNSGSDNRYVLGVLGSHYRISEHVLLGALVQLDHQSTKITGKPGAVEGTGVMVGPYFVARHQEQPLFYEGRLLYGRSWNEISPSGGYTDNFMTQRWLAMFRMSGEYRNNNTLIFPFIDASYASDHQLGYRDSADRWIMPQSVGIGRLELGLDMSHRISDDLTLTTGTSGIWSVTDVSGNSDALGKAYEGGTAELRGGITYEPTDGLTVKGKLSYGGIGRRGSDRVGASFELTSEF